MGRGDVDPAAAVAHSGAVPLTTWMLIGSLAVVRIVGVGDGIEGVRALPGLGAWGALLYAGVLEMVGVMVFWQPIVQRQGTVTTRLYTNLQLEVAMVQGVAFLGGSVRLMQVVGLLPLFVSLLVARRAAVTQQEVRGADRVGRRAD